MALTLGDNFSYQGAKPLDARLKYETVAAMKAVADATMYDGCLAYCAGTDKTYQWKSGNTVDETLGKWREFQAGGGGTTYEAGDGIDITDDTISIDPMPAEDMDEIVTPLPGTHAKRIKYSTDEQVIGEWIDGKPIYQRTIDCDLSGLTPSTERTAYVLADFTSSGLNIPVDTVVGCEGLVIPDTSNPNSFPFSCTQNISTTTISSQKVTVTVTYYFIYGARSGIVCVASGNYSYFYQAISSGTGKVIVTVRYTKTTD